jgi:hypothetical protein
MEETIMPNARARLPQTVAGYRDGHRRDGHAAPSSFSVSYRCAAAARPGRFGR